MKKLAYIAAISAIVTAPAFAVSVGYNGNATSGTAADPMASLSVVAGGTTSLFYVDPASGTASNRKTPAIQLVKTSDWSFDFSDLSHVTFTGNIAYGDYATQDTVTSPIVIDGRQTYYGVTQSFSGVGSFDQATNTFTYTFQNATSDGGGGSVETHTNPAICVNGTTSILGTVCGNFSATPGALNWEGLALSFVFSPDRSTFSGALTGTNKAGAGLTASTTTINWQVTGAAAAPAVPLPAAAWLFGSGLLGLTGLRRRA